MYLNSKAADKSWNINQSQYLDIWQCQNLTDFRTRYGTTMHQVVSNEYQKSMFPKWHYWLYITNIVWNFIPNCGRCIAERTMSITMSANWRMLKKQLIIGSTIEVHRLKFQMFSKRRRLFQMNHLISYRASWVLFNSYIMTCMYIKLNVWYGYNKT